MNSTRVQSTFSWVGGMVLIGFLGQWAGSLAVAGVIAGQVVNSRFGVPEPIGWLLGGVLAAAAAYPACHLAWLYRRSLLATVGGITLLIGEAVFVIGLMFLPVAALLKHVFGGAMSLGAAGIISALVLAWVLVRRIPQGTDLSSMIKRWTIASWILYGGFVTAVIAWSFLRG
jgi:hypothetical protein